MTAIPLWASRLYNEPLALDPFKNEVLCQFAEARLLGAKTNRIDATTLDQASVNAMAEDASHYSDGVRKPFASKDGIAVIPVRGTLVQRSSWMNAESGLVGYDTIVKQAKAAANDPEISGIWIPFDSRGGEAAGMFAAAEQIAALAKAEGGKPIYAWLDEKACSAAYALASACDKIYGRRECMAGSISALINTVDVSAAMTKAGIKPVVIRPEWSPLKGGPQFGEEITPEHIAPMQRIVDDCAAQFVEFVSAMRGISEKEIRSLGGQVFTGPDLVRHKLIDAVVSEADAWGALKTEAGSL